MKLRASCWKLSKSFSVNSIQKKFCSTSKDIVIELPKFECTDLDPSAFPTKTTTNKDELIKYFTELTRMRRMEIECDNLYKNREIRGFCHLYNGQESIAVGMEAALTYEDALITAYREHCNQIGRGDTPYRVIAEQMGKSTGSTGGKGGSMHLYYRKNNFYGGNGIVGAQIPLGTGIAFAMKYLNKPNVCIAMFGDGSANQGQLFESQNMAGLWKLPIIYIVENNKYGMGTSQERHSNHLPLYSKFRNLPGLRADGMNIFVVREILKYAKNYAIKNGPLFIELDTYRYQGHSMSDPGISYRSRDEIYNIRAQRDCINSVKKLILNSKFSTETELRKIEKDIKADFEVQVAKIKEDPFPDPKELLTDVFYKEDVFIRGVEYNSSYFPKKG